ncbi:MAG: molybdopterin-guanine dinucleotide biosynthesis protein B [Desulfarculaceae bacterium]|nr:molybdopterin-guanine dinucleotide biosynthesis protein B [Desulfarculaceae bacterium]MCF8074377.1 molybdopterin-guanine dinucleotide biosynthesis protein B [Desulfarculaceae bacterium]MCF8103820.1 molybdopterin-guanine dinucleotide biosynthesis protein B [Desulfarculaceae bacterium]MCF8118159.1 molybdopterin-guanine dinucleotide biosynthesis protein B [Desulfarculaceae bacterium]
MIPVIGICGASGSGKTTLVAKLLPLIKARGIKVGVLKHHGHGEAVPTPAEWEGKDSARLAEAGADRVGLAHPGGVWLEAPHLGGAGPRALTARLMGGLELVIAEGFKRAGIPKIEVVAPGAQPILPPGGRLLALARRGGSGSEAELPVLDADDPEAVLAFILEAVRQVTPAPEKAVLLVDGQEVPVNAFVISMLSGMLRGFVSSLKGADSSGKIEVRLG